jgi:hypothetical protein
MSENGLRTGLLMGSVAPALHAEVATHMQSMFR